MKLRYLALALLFLSSSSRAANVQSLTLRSDQKATMVRWAYDDGDLKKLKGTSRALADLKFAFSKGDFRKCMQLAPALQKSAKALASWVAYYELTCAAAQTFNSGVAREVETALTRNYSHKEWFLLGPPAPLLRTAYVNAALALLEFHVKNNRGIAWRLVDEQMILRSWMDEKQRARLYRFTGELSFIQQKFEAAHDYLRRSLQEHEVPEVRARYNVLNNNIFHRTELPAQAPTPTGEPQLEASAQELEYARRVEVGMSGGDYLPAVEDGVRLIRGFPGGTRAKWASEKILDAFLALAERTDPSANNVRERILREMERTDEERLADWAASLYGRGYYAEAFRIGKSALGKMSETSRSTRVYELTAEAAIAVEKWGDAKDLLQNLVQRHAGTPSAREALLRLALVHFRLREFPPCIAALERLLVLPQADQMELTARYWLWRALQKQGVERAAEQQDILQNKFPFSYYGLRARAEKNAGVLEWTRKSAEPIQVKIWLTASEMLVWERVQVLLQAGWLEEAQAEIKDLPVPQTPEEKAMRALTLAAALNYVPAVKYINEAWDDNPSLRADPFLEVGFPMEFRNYISQFSDNNALHPSLVASLTKQESGFGPRAISRSGAMGLMQIIPPTAKEIAGDLKLGELKLPDDMFQPERNIQMGTHYLAKMASRYSLYVPLALAAYNAGPSRLDRWLRTRAGLQGLIGNPSSRPEDELWFDELPWSETSFYVKAILRNWLIYQVLEQGRVRLADPVWAGAAQSRKPAGHRPK